MLALGQTWASRNKDHSGPAILLRFSNPRSPLLSNPALAPTLSVPVALPALGSPLGTLQPFCVPLPPSPASRLSQWHVSFLLAPPMTTPIAAQSLGLTSPAHAPPRVWYCLPPTPPPAQLCVHWLMLVGGGVARAGAGRPPSCASRNLIPLLRPRVCASRHSLAAVQLDPLPAVPLPQAGVRPSPPPLGQVRPPRGVTRLPRGR